MLIKKIKGYQLTLIHVALSHTDNFTYEKLNNNKKKSIDTQMSQVSQNVKRSRSDYTFVVILYDLIAPQTPISAVKQFFSLQIKDCILLFTAL